MIQLKGFKPDYYFPLKLLSNMINLLTFQFSALLFSTVCLVGEITLYFLFTNLDRMLDTHD